SKGILKQIEVNSRIIDYEDSKAILTIVRDTTERKQIEQKILQTIIQTEEKERGRLAKELHDGIGPLLSASKIYAKAIQNVETEEEKKYIFEKLDESINEAIVSAQEISGNISPHVLTNFGLKIALESFYKKINLGSKVKFNIQSNFPDRFDEHIETTLYRVSIELIHNTLKHSGATEINIDILKNNGTLYLQYHDNGKGFNIEKTMQESTGMGLSNIFSRIRSLNGKVSMESKENKGINLFIQIDL
ncbi:MAG: ATP-binding protein, partial [Bacteroidota bacterium]